MMRWLILGALIGLLIAFPPLLGLVLAGAGTILGHPYLIAFGLGLAARPYLPQPRRWAR
ncbi:hypothetical protein [Streptomyces griseosporeus]